ncbi:MAG: carboxypeptidase-like regulatory domain-containing protein [Bacteroidetes bacterium]|nr:carboxypeptidase-like regulatory domain-containing protein [Bacteroidota bacterium]
MKYYKSNVVGFYLLILFCCNINFLHGQVINSPDTLVIDAKILDKESSEPLPYATIYNQSSARGTVSDLEGMFKLKGVTLNDTLIISYIGYSKKMIVVTRSMINEVIFLNPKAEPLTEVLVFADNSHLYDLIASCKKTRTNRSRTAKTYFSLESHINGFQVELLECYYNGEFAGYDVTELRLKNGRIGLTEFGNRFFVSTETSKALYMQKLFHKNVFFSQSPFELSKTKLKKQYDLFVKSKYLDDDSATVYVVNFVPKDSTQGLFKGQVWFDSSNSRIIKVNLEAINTTTHPFIPHGNIDSLTQVDIYISKTYRLIDGDMYVNSIDFNYQISYKTVDAQLFSVSTNAVLYAYDYTDQFLLPLFQFSSGSYVDYRKINAAPYNQFFWDNIQEFGMTDIKDKNDLFHKNKSTMTGQTLFINNPYFVKGLFDHPYVFWSENRIRFRDDLSDNLDYTSYEGAIPLERYNLVVQIYLDINQLNDSLNIITSTVFDPFESYYHFPLTNEGMAFINMYFDVIEIHRRELDSALGELEDIRDMISLYDEKIEELEKISRSFFNDVVRGTNKDGMLKWNKFIRNEIKIDNIALFNLY